MYLHGAIFMYFSKFFVTLFTSPFSELRLVGLDLDVVD